MGADIVVHSTSKFINGTGSTIGGAIVDMGRFDWQSAKFPHFEPFFKKYRGFAFTARTEKAGPQGHRGLCRAHEFISFVRRNRTLALRMERHCSNALQLARFLQEQPTVSWVNYPGLDDNPFHQVAKRLYGDKFGGVLTFGLADKAAAFRFINGVRMARNLANIGDAKTLVIHPASTICADFGPQEKALMGVGEEMVRVSAGIENINDIIEDFQSILRQPLRKETDNEFDGKRQSGRH